MEKVSILVLVFISVVNLILGIAVFIPCGLGVVKSGLVGTLTYVGLRRHWPSRW
ncbi:hypothetical protein [Thermococcus sp.]|uniref:hypothetical protein n=1 Tax=Thermococcus sp. TaxID=35749 RepID=UPI002637BE7A|nr:hypothetical protein [Thermococcus sp.]